MPNFFTDNANLEYRFEQLDLEEIVALRERDYAEAELRDDAPRDYAEAVDGYRAALELLGRICGDDIAPLRQGIDIEGAHFKDGRVRYAEGSESARRLLSESGFMGAALPREFGGLQFPASIYLLMVEMVSRADASLMTLFGYQDVGELIARFGDRELAERFLPGLASGELIGAIVLSEPGAGSDLQAIRLRAEQDSDGNWRLNGIKHFISNGCGDVLMVLAKSEPGQNNIFGLSLFACPGGENVIVNRVEEKMGLHGSPTCELEFRDAPAYLVGSRRFGFSRYILESLNQARFSVAAQAIGIAEAALREAAAYALKRRQFGRVIGEFPAVQNLLLDIETAIVVSRALVCEGAYWLDLKVALDERIVHLKRAGEDSAELRARQAEANRRLNLLSPMVKYIATEAANRACYDAQQVFGGMGYMRETGVEQLARDVRITTIYEGTSQVQVAASLKSVMADVLAGDFDRLQTKITDRDPLLLECLATMRGNFAGARDFVEDKKDSAFADAAARNLVDSYGDILAGYLMLAADGGDARQALLTHRFLLRAAAASAARAREVTDGLFETAD